MRVVLFCHSLVSDWNHGNAHFLRGVCTALQSRGHEVAVFEPVDGWSRANLVAEHGAAAEWEFHAAFPHLESRRYDLEDIDLG
jgi:spore maturation protein CgeB